MGTEACDWARTAGPEVLQRDWFVHQVLCGTEVSLEGSSFGLYDCLQFGDINASESERLRSVAGSWCLA